MAFASPDVLTQDRTSAEPAVKLHRRGLSGIETLLVLAVVVSFSYEIPLVYVTGFYKANPYLFDVATFSLVAYWLLYGRARGWVPSLTKNPALQPFAFLVLVFTLATMMSVAWIPFKHYIKSLWYLFKYFEGLLVLVILFSAPIDERAKRRMMWAALLGGTWVSFYAVLQFVGAVTTVRVIPRGTEILQEGTGIYSTLGATYFHAGFFGVISALVGLAVFMSSKGFKRILAGGLAGFASFPAILSGSRAAFFGLLIGLGFLAIQPRFRKQVATYLLGALLAGGIAYVYGMSYTKERTETRGIEASARTRTFSGFKTLGLAWNTHGPRLLIAGGGFMVVPIDRGGGRLEYRAGYGNHNIHLFPLEQAGILGLVGALWLYWRLFTFLGRQRHNWPLNDTDENLRSAMFAFFAAVMIVGVSGSSFWLQNLNEHFFFYEMLFFGLALTPTGETKAPARPVAPASFSPAPPVQPVLPSRS